MLSPGIWCLFVGLIIFVFGGVFVIRKKNKAPYTDVDIDEEPKITGYSSDPNYVANHPGVGLSGWDGHNTVRLRPVEDIFHDLGIESEKPKIEKLPKKVAKKKAVVKKKAAKKSTKKTTKPKK